MKNPIVEYNNQRRKEIVHLACELMEEGTEIFSCHALNVVQGGIIHDYTELTESYVKFLGLEYNNGAPNSLQFDFDDDVCGIRILFMLMFLETYGTDWEVENE